MASDSHIFVTAFQVWPFKKVWYRSVCGQEKAERPCVDVDASCARCQAMLKDSAVLKECRRLQMKYSALKSFEKTFGLDAFEGRPFVLPNERDTLRQFIEEDMG